MGYFEDIIPGGYDVTSYIPRKNRINKMTARYIFESDTNYLFDILSDSNLFEDLEDLYEMTEVEMVNYVLALPNKTLLHALIMECYEGLLLDIEL